MQRSCKFSLVELLVVIAVIAILASILLPAMNRAREMASRSSCSNNMRQILLGMNVYASDFSGILPTVWGISDAKSWAYYLRPYLKVKDNNAVPYSPLYSCRSASSWAKGNILSYGMNLGINAENSETLLRLWDFAKPAEQMLLGDTKKYDSQIYGYFSFIGSENEKTIGRLEFRHSGMSNFTFADSHVESIPITGKLSPIAGPFWWKTPAIPY